MLGTIAKNLLSIADSVLPVIGGPLGSAATSIAHSVINAIDSTKTVFSQSDQAALQAKRDELEAAVMAHADKTISSLDG